MSQPSHVLRATSEMKVRDEVTLDELREIVADVTRDTESEQGDHVPGHNYYLDEETRTLFVHEHYRDAEGMLTHFGNMDQDKVNRLMSAVEVVDLRIYGPLNDQLREMLAAYGSARYFDFVSGFQR